MTKQYYIAAAVDTKTNKTRYMSLPANQPLLELPAGLNVSESMLLGFINGRSAKTVVDKYHFINWCFNHDIKADQNSRVQITAINRVDSKTHDEFIEWAEQSVA